MIQQYKYVKILKSCGGHINKAPPKLHAGPSRACLARQAPRSPPHSNALWPSYFTSSPPSLGNCECALVRGGGGGSVSDRAIPPHQASSQYPTGTIQPLSLALVFPQDESMPSHNTLMIDSVNCPSWSLCEFAIVCLS